MNRLLHLFVWLSCVGILRTKMGLALGLGAAVRGVLHQGPVWAVHVERPKSLYFNSFCDC